MIPSIRNIFITAVASISLVGFDVSANQIIQAAKILVPASKINSANRSAQMGQDGQEQVIAKCLIIRE